MVRATLRSIAYTIDHPSESVSYIIREFGVEPDLAQQGAAQAAQIREQVRASPVVHTDETGWREIGRNGYVWTFSTATARSFVRGSRAGNVVDAALGPAFAGALVSDFYAAYDHVLTAKQRCWAHLLRDVHSLRQQHPDDAGLAAWATRLHTLFERGRAGATGPTPGSRTGQRGQPAVRAKLQAALVQLATLTDDGAAAFVSDASWATAAIRRRAVYLRDGAARAPGQQCRGAQPTAPGDSAADQRGHSLVCGLGDSHGREHPVRHLARPAA